ncbi:family S53 protease [Dendrothele bispora CBS 962.96]|uniref:tripeptidyl-peptidase II n=1 Tax=Dendrothele bispora (strain CBS 962.96) TaxID=1314807 RepID=A0A4S8M313_DENBC|nr:family S53 protease [Dendrothele bispora CBS 962.96]
MAARILSFTVLASAILVACTPTRWSMTVTEQRTLPITFFSTGKPDSETKIDLRIALAQKNMAGLEKALYDVSTPSSAFYGQHLSFDEVKVYAEPSEETVNAVTRWLQESGVSDFEMSGPFNEWISINIQASKADELFDASFEQFVHIESGEHFIRTLQYSVPQNLVQHIELVHPTTAFVRPFVKRPVMSVPVPRIARNITKRANSAPSSCDDTVTPACLQALYGIPSTPATQSSNKLGVSGFNGLFAENADLKTFLTKLRPDMPSMTNFTVLSVDGGQNLQGVNQTDSEANLDIQYTVGIATGVPTVFITVGNNNSDSIGGFLDVINALNAEYAPPQVWTTSYGFDERDINSTLANRICNAYMTLGARGVSILVSSGDGGVSGGQSQDCGTGAFIPAFPGGCPFHTAVGATQGVNETAAFFSSGGFSNVFSRPWYQDYAVTTYLDALGNDTYAGLFNRSGRAFPDIAAQGVNVEIVSGGLVDHVAGTSCSSPIFASVVSLINDRLIAAGKPYLRNPWILAKPFSRSLYANPQAFFDILNGSNPGCGTDGFPARVGWDPVTGLGTPNFEAMLKAAGL